MQIYLLFLCFGVSFSANEVVQQSCAWQVDEPDVSQICGRNSLFMLLRFHGIDCSLSEVADSVPVSHVGTSLAELNSVAEQFGLPCEMIKCDLQSLQDSGRLPCIILTDGGGFIPDNAGNPIPGHYWILERFSDDGQTIYVIDGTYGLPGTYTRKRFSERWNGIALLPMHRWITLEWLASGAHVAIWAAVFLIAKQRRTRNSVLRNEVGQ